LRLLNSSIKSLKANGGKRTEATLPRAVGGDVTKGGKSGRARMKIKEREKRGGKTNYESLCLPVDRKGVRMGELDGLLNVIPGGRGRRYKKIINHLKDLLRGSKNTEFNHQKEGRVTNAGLKTRENFTLEGSCEECWRKGRDTSTRDGEIVEEHLGLTS